MAAEPGMVYRGVHAGHPALAEARKGVVYPGKIDGSLTPADHNKGEVSHISQYTSWTRDRAIAKFHAEKFGPGGVVVEFPFDHPNPGDEWAWETSPDEFDEQEVLLRGIRSGATVILV